LLTAEIELCGFVAFLSIYGQCSDYATGWTTGVQFPAEVGIFSLHRRAETGSVAHSASYPMGTVGSFPGSKAAEAWRWSLTSIWCRG